METIGQEYTSVAMTSGLQGYIFLLSAEMLTSLWAHAQCDKFLKTKIFTLPQHYIHNYNNIFFTTHGYKLHIIKTQVYTSLQHTTFL